jgi:hypothetical protein
VYHLAFKEIIEFGKKILNPKKELHLRKFTSIPLEFLFAFYTAEMICFAIMANLIFGCLFVQNHTTDRIPRHRFILHVKQFRTALDKLCLLKASIIEILQFFKRLLLITNHLF